MANLRVDKITSTETFETTGSVQFGNDNALKISANSGFDLTSNDFTLECWVYMNSVESFQTLLLYTVDGTEDDTVWQFDITSTQLRFVGYVSNSSEVYGSNFSFGSGTWYHVAATRTNGLVRLFVDGDLIGTHPFTSTLDTEASAELNIGYRNNQGTMDREVFGHLSNIRVIKGKALYTSNFKTPMRELEVTPETTLLCCQSKTDASHEKTGKTITVLGNAVASELTPGILTPVPKAGAGSAITGSVEFDGTGDYLVPTGSDFGLSSSDDFTLETWIHATSFDNSSTYSEVLRQGTNNAGTDGMYLSALSAGTVEWRLSGTTKTSTNKMTAGSWNHIAVCRASGTVYISVNGLTENFGSVTNSSTTSAFRIGANFESNQFFKGHLSNVRFVKGTALYTDNFIPPTRELKKVPGTVLLCCQDPDDPLTEATGKTITGNGDLQRADGVELITNGTFNSDVSNWTATDCTLTYSSGQMQVTRSGGSGLTANQAFTTVAGNKYNLSGTINSSGSRGDLRVYNGSGTGGSLIVSLSGTNGAVTDLRGTFIASSTTSTVVIAIDDNSTSVTVDNISVTLAEGSNKGSNFTPQVGDDRKVTFEGVTKVNSDAYFYLPTGDTVTRESRSGRVLIAGGNETPPSNVISYVNASTSGNAVDFGDLVTARRRARGLSSSTRGVFTGGFTTTPTSTYFDIIDFVTISTTGNAVDFGGDTSGAASYNNCASSTRGIMSGGLVPSSPNITANINFLTIASTGEDVSTFGDLTVARRNAAGFASPTRGVFAAGFTPVPASTVLNTIDFITIASTGNAVDFGDCATTGNGAGSSNSTRGVFQNRTEAGDEAIEYVTIASKGNSQEFGSQVTALYMGSEQGGATATRALWCGGYTNPGGGDGLNNIFYVNIATTGDVQDFGDLTQGTNSNATISDSHGGLG